MNQLHLIDINGRFGTSLNRHCGFPSAGDLLRHLDHLGIERAVAFNVEGREGECSYVNQKTLREIAETQGGQGRLMTAFSISPVMMYPEGAMGNLRKMVGTHGAALHFTRGLSGYFIGQCAPIFDALKDLQPAVLLNFEDCDRHDLLETAKTHPETTFILTDIIWGRMSHVLDLMSRVPNICVETSWLHVADDIEILCERFGPERVFFGAGEMANRGAAIAALMHAAIPGSARELIAHGNAERVLRLPAAPGIRTGQSGLAANTLWNSLVDGRPLDLPVVDAHYHLGGSGGYVLKRNDLESQIPRALELADRVGVRTMIVSGISALIGEPLSEHILLEKALSPHGSRFRGYVGFNPKFSEALAERFDDYFSRPFFIGFKTLCDYWQVPITDPRFRPMFAYANRHRLPVLNHTWDGAFDSPAMFARLAVEYPGAQFIIGHSGGGNGGRREAEQLAAMNPNVWLEWCGSFCATTPWEESFTRVPPAKMVFGTDALMHNPVWELGRLLSLDMPEALIRPMLGKTMLGIMAMRR